jgi:hypothetical protein
VAGIAFIGEDRTYLKIIADSSRITTRACFFTGEIPEDKQPCYTRYTEQCNDIELLHNASLTIRTDKLFKGIPRYKISWLMCIRMVRIGTSQSISKVKESSRYFLIMVSDVNRQGKITCSSKMKFSHQCNIVRLSIVREDKNCCICCHRVVSAVV